MVKIRVTPEHLNQLSHEFSVRATELQAIVERLGHTINNVDLEVRNKAGILGEWQQANTQARNLAQASYHMSLYLERKAQAFQDADQEGASSIATMPALGYSLPPATPASGSYPLPPDIQPLYPGQSERNRLLENLAALRPLIKDIILDKLLIGEILDWWTVFRMDAYYDRLDAAARAAEEARNRYGPGSSEAVKAQDGHYDVRKWGDANPVQ
jgi:uncharacterized protein YukE